MKVPPPGPGVPAGRVLEAQSAEAAAAVEPSDPIDTSVEPAAVPPAEITPPADLVQPVSPAPTEDEAAFLHAVDAAFSMELDRVVEPGSIVAGVLKGER